MDLCNSEANINNLRSRLRVNMSVPKRYAKRFTKNQACNAYRKCKTPNVLPPMKLSRYNGYMYLIDRNSPFRTVKEYSIILESGKKSELIRIANSKLSLFVDKSMTKEEIRDTIINALVDMKISQPIKAFKISERVPKKNATSFNNNMNGNVGNNQGNGNFRNNQGNGNFGNNQGNGNFGNNQGNGNFGNNQGNGNFGNNQGTEPLNFTPGRPIVKAPRARINGNNNGQLNMMSNFISTPKPTMNMPMNNSKNFSKLFKRIKVLKDNIGVFEKKVLANANNINTLRKEYTTLGGLSNNLSKNELKRRINGLKKGVAMGTRTAPSISTQTVTGATNQTVESVSS